MVRITFAWSCLTRVNPCLRIFCSRDFYSISKYLSVPSTLAVLILLVIVIVTLMQDNNEPFGKSTTYGPLPDITILDFLEALSAFVFAYQGQAIYLELMSEMKDSK
jgi:amino acid permease